MSATDVEVTASRVNEEVLPGEDMEVEPEVAPLPSPVNRTSVTSDTLAIGVVQVRGETSPVPVLVVPYHQDRLRITVKNQASSADFVYIGSFPSLTGENDGVRLAQNDTLTLETRAALYAICAAGTVVPLSFISELRQNDER